MRSSLGNSVDQRVLHLLTTVDADPRQELRLYQAALLVNLSVAHLSHVFKTETGTSPGNYFKLARMEHAASLLSGTFLSVKEVMSHSGFCDESHFVRDFKKIYGQTPTEYRRNATNESENRPTDHKIGQ